MKSAYMRVASRILVPTAVFALTGWALHLVGSGLASLAGYDLARLWEGAGAFLGLDDAWLRLVVYAGLQLLTLSHLWPWLHQGGKWLERRRQDVERRTASLTRGPRWVPVRRGAQVLSTLAVTGLLVAFLVQPTLVPLRVDGSAFLHRAANLLDGRATAALFASAAGLWRVATAEPVPPLAPVSRESFYTTLDAPVVPLIDRWDGALWEATHGDRTHFAITKAILWVESGGRQYALSATGCAGLMQFCTTTAQRFHGIFGMGQVRACGCRSCTVPREIQIALETTDSAVDEHASSFPCDLTDARFDGEKSIRAGTAFVKELSQDLGGNLLLIYVGYNSGPRVAQRLYKTLGSPRSVALEDLRPHLAKALAPYYGKRAAGRADGLLNTHLPKLQAAYDKWKDATPPSR